MDSGRVESERDISFEMPLLSKNMISKHFPSCRTDNVYYVGSCAYPRTRIGRRDFMPNILLQSIIVSMHRKIQLKQPMVYLRQSCSMTGLSVDVERECSTETRRWSSDDISFVCTADRDTKDIVRLRSYSLPDSRIFVRRYARLPLQHPLPQHSLTLSAFGIARSLMVALAQIIQWTRWREKRQTSGARKLET
jgi:hypothetical protein